MISPDSLGGIKAVLSVTPYAEKSYKAHEKRGLLGTGDYSANGTLTICVRVAPAAVRDILF